MSGFVFNSARSIICEPGAVDNIGDIVKNNIEGRVLIVTDQGIVDSGLLDYLCSTLKKSNVHFSIYKDVKADPPEEIVNEACDFAREENIQGVIGFGGGSSLDVAKIVALLIGGNDELQEIYGFDKAKGTRLPLIQIPTTAGTGSEITTASVLSVGGATKAGILSPQLVPDFAILDANLTVGLPSQITASTGIDAIVHAIEGYTSLNVNNNPLSKILARQALSLLGANIHRVVENGKDIKARSDMLLGSMLAGLSFSNSSVAAVHAFAHALGGTHHVPHGLSNSLFLPHVMKYNSYVCSDDYSLLACDLFPNLAKLEKNERVDGFITSVAELGKDLGLATSLREVGVKENEVSEIVSETLKAERILANNPREVDEKSAFELCWKAF